MSLGALSPEAHEALAIAMNRLGARSNSGEGGEDPARYRTEKNSKIKQVASGRFGVTPEYLINAEVLQIKVAQGAKPGEGGQLPGHKVNEMIARLRFARPGVGLISPPPHHDIYSIEDLAQLIFDLKQVNPQALVSVKLVAEPGVGTVAAGVAKAYADLITISGYDGGTGASPLSSIKYAGTPWELGLAETHQTLRINDLRHRVRLQTDGGLKTGLDVIKAAIIGAESFGFGTAPMVALGCKYLRICHLNNCATGVATQHNVLRSKYFIGLPEMVINYFRFVAQEVREILASARRAQHRRTSSASTEFLRDPRRRDAEAAQARSHAAPLHGGTCRGCAAVLRDAVERAVRQGRARRAHGARHAARHRGQDRRRVEATRSATSTARIGARISGEIARRWGNYGMEDAPLVVRLTGNVGQSFGVWNAGGLHLYLEGDANDYVGKGMAAGKLVLRPSAQRRVTSRKDTIIMGNTCLYGATGGQLFAAGVAGERFAVRNSGAIAVIEGAGDHCCEYMTGGVVCVLGRTGVNFGAGFTGGFAYVLDLDRNFVDRYNHELIDISRIHAESMQSHLQHLETLIEQHVAETGSAWGEEILQRPAHLHRQVLGREAEGGLDRLADRESAARGITSLATSKMADKNLQFLDIPRADPAKMPVETRVTELQRDLRAVRAAGGAAQQAGRCLACGNPFCEWKCPVHNYIPELAEAHPGRQPVRGGGAVAQDELAAGSVRAHLPAGSPVRGRLHAE